MDITLHPIGIIHSPFEHAQGTPIQPVMGKEAEGTVLVDAAYEEGLAGLEGFDRIWLLYYFDRAKPAQMTVTPYMDQQPHGLFSTRAPTRPNPIGLSCVRLLERDGYTLRVGGIDVLDGTPLLDIKPYVPRFDVYPIEHTGWLDTASRRQDTDVSADPRFEE